MAHSALSHAAARTASTYCAAASARSTRKRRTITGAPPAPRVQLRPSPCPGGNAPNRDRRRDRGVCRRSWQQPAPRVSFRLVDGASFPPIVSCPCRHSARRRLEFSGKFKMNRDLFMVGRILCLRHIDLVAIARARTATPTAVKTATKEEKAPPSPSKRLDARPDCRFGIAQIQKSCRRSRTG